MYVNADYKVTDTNLTLFLVKHNNSCSKTCKMKKIKIFKTYGSNCAYFLLQESEKFVKNTSGSFHCKQNKQQNITRSSAIADGPRNTVCQSKSCQMLHNSVGTTCTTSPEQIEVMELEGYIQPTIRTRCLKGIKRMLIKHCV